jgi:hypothetical protein
MTRPDFPQLNTLTYKRIAQLHGVFVISHWYAWEPDSILNSEFACSHRKSFLFFSVRPAYAVINDDLRWSSFRDASSHLARRENPTCYGARRFIAMLTGAHNWNLFWARWVETASSCTVSSRFMSMYLLSAHIHLRLLNYLFPWGCSTSTLFAIVIRTLSYRPSCLWITQKISEIWRHVNVSIQKILTASSKMFENYKSNFRKRKGSL